MQKNRRILIKEKIRKYVISINPFCVYCKSIKNLTIDHIYPVSLGGNNDPGNITVACARCNSIKYNYDIDDFLMSILQKRHKEYMIVYKNIYNLKCLLCGIKVHYMHDMNGLIYKIKNSKKNHSYFTEIINSIINKKYKIFNDA